MSTYKPEQLNEKFLPDKQYPEEIIISSQIYPGDEKIINRQQKIENLKFGDYRIIEYLGRPSDRPWSISSRTKNKPQITWRIRCSCGLEKDISSGALNSLKSGIKNRIMSSHCTSPAHKKMFSLGTKYDLLTIIGYKKCTPERAGRKFKTDDKRWYLLCSCSCGKHNNKNPYMTTPYEISDPLSKGMKGFGCGCKQITHGFSGTDAYMRFENAKHRAKIKNLDFNLEPSDCIAPENCPVFGIPLISSQGKGQTYNSPHLDRLVGDKGYVKENVVVISMKANTIKNSATVKQIRLVADWLEEKILEIEKQNI